MGVVVFGLVFLLFTLWIGGLNDLIEHKLNVLKKRKDMENERDN